MTQQRVDGDARVQELTAQLSRERQIDCLLSIHLFGRVPCQGEYHVTNTDYWLCHVLPDSPDHGGEADLYSTSGDGMLMVVDAMRKRGYWYIVIPSQNGYEIAFYLPDGSKCQPNEDTAHDPRMMNQPFDLPFGTALAALCALGVTVPAGEPQQ